jgi:hypothetical protein
MVGVPLYANGWIVIITIMVISSFNTLIMNTLGVTTATTTITTILGLVSFVYAATWMFYFRPKK